MTDDYYSILPGDYYTSLREIGEVLGERYVSWPGAVAGVRSLKEKEQELTIRLTERQLSKTIALDFDGVLHSYREGWKDGTIYDTPIPGAVDACYELIKHGYTLVVFTARQAIPDIENWLGEHGFPKMKVTNTKPPAIFYVDDRAIQFKSWPQAMFEMARQETTIGVP